MAVSTCVLVRILMMLSLKEDGTYAGIHDARIACSDDMAAIVFELVVALVSEEGLRNLSFEHLIMVVMWSHAAGVHACTVV